MCGRLKRTPTVISQPLNIITIITRLPFYSVQIIHLFNISNTTLCLRNVPTFELLVTFSNINRFSKFLHCWKAYLLQSPYDITNLTLGLSLHYFGKLKIQIFFRYSADMKNANTSHFYPISLCYHPQILIFSVFDIANFSPD